ncbi:MAG TPA: hypothetical protein PKX91_01025 [Clostridia bacterium]|nr:hypothetical protein [Clostridia bacterium]
MKNRFLLVVSIVLLVSILALIVVGCNSDKDEEPEILSIEAEFDKTVKLSVGDTFDKSKIKITAKLSDDTTRALKSESQTAVEYDLKALELDSSGKLTKAGKFEITVKFSTFETQLEINVTE